MLGEGDLIRDQVELEFGPRGVLNFILIFLPSMHAKKSSLGFGFPLFLFVFDD